eukprot:365975-Chlamydomonas_euryale.AAC.9
MVSLRGVNVEEGDGFFAGCERVKAWDAEEGEERVIVSFRDVNLGQSQLVDDFGQTAFGRVRENDECDTLYAANHSTCHYDIAGGAPSLLPMHLKCFLLTSALHGGSRDHCGGPGVQEVWRSWCGGPVCAAPPSKRSPTLVPPAPATHPPSALPLWCPAPPAPPSRSVRDDAPQQGQHCEAPEEGKCGQGRSHDWHEWTVWRRRRSR